MANRARRSMPALVFLLGDKLVDRLRSVTFAMLGAITAIGLILVALVLQQGWPSVFGGPLPGFSNGPPADEAVSAAPGISAGGVAPAPQSVVGDAPPRSGSGGSDSAGSRGARGAHDVVAATPVSSAPADPAPVEAAPEPQAPPPVAEPPPVSTPAASAPPAGAPVASAGDGGDEDEDKRSAAGSEKPAKSKDKVLANAKGSPPSKGAAASKPKSSAPKPKSPGSKAPTAPVEQASAEAKLPPVPVPSKDEADPLPVEEKDEQDSGHGYGKSKGK